MMKRLAGVLMISAALLSNVVFIALGAVFDYPEVLRKPAAQILAKFAADQALIVTLFLLLAAAAAAMIPIAVILGGRVAATIGVLAGFVQVLGLMRWAYAVPPLAAAHDDPSAILTFQVLHSYLGVGVGETLGYLGTATWTLLVLSIGPRWTRVLGAVAASAIAIGVLEPAGLEIAGTINFAGYVLWSFWLIIIGWYLIRSSSAESVH